jgi:hypothetical protein
MSEVDTLRGTEVQIGRGFKFVMPQEPPVTNEEIIEREELIAKIDRAVAPFRQISDRGKLCMDTLRKDITTAVRMRFEEKDQGPSLVDGAEMAETPGKGRRAKAEASS